MIRKAIHKILEQCNIYIIYRFGNAIGEQLLMSALADEIKKQNRLAKIIIVTSFPELFEYNPDIHKVYKHTSADRYPKKLVWKILKRIKGGPVHEFRFPIKSLKNRVDDMIEAPYPMSLIEANSYGFGMKIDFSKVKPKIYFDDEELKHFEQKFDLPEQFAIVLPQAKTSYTPNKDWGFERFQDVVSATKEKITWVQTGMSQDKSLEGAIDLRGKTDSLRELAFLVYKSRCVLANEGLMNHMAAAVDKKSYVVFGGFHPVEIANYDITVPVTAKVLPECAPCWLLDSCPVEGMPCLKSITPKMVIDALYKNETILKGAGY